jgi:tripartite ATP-independent transporter DctM subunit
MEWVSILMFFVAIIVLLFGYPVAFSLGGIALIFSFIGSILGIFDIAFLGTLPNRLYGIMSNETLMAVPLFVFMGITLEKAKIAEDLLTNLSQLFGKFRGGLGISVTIVGMLLAASTGIVGATVVTMGLMSLPSMLKRGYDPSLAAGTICASGTLGQIIPPSIVLVLLGDVLSSAYSQAQLDSGIFSPDTVSVGDLFVGALVPGLLLVLCYIFYIFILSIIRPELMPALEADDMEPPRIINVLKALLPPLILIFAVLGSIIGGFATPTEAAGVGASGALLLAAIKRSLSFHRLREVMLDTVKVSSMVFLILIGASLFSLVFRGYGGDHLVRDTLLNLPGGTFSAIFCVMLLMFLLGFVLDFIEIIFVVVPIVAPVLLMLDIDPVWLGVMIAMNLQTSFLTPPFGFALFYLRGVAPDSLSTRDIYRGAIPFVIIQIGALIMLAIFPAIATWLPGIIYG